MENLFQQQLVYDCKILKILLMFEIEGLLRLSGHNLQARIMLVLMKERQTSLVHCHRSSAEWKLNR